MNKSFKISADYGDIKKGLNEITRLIKNINPNQKIKLFDDQTSKILQKASASAFKEINSQLVDTQKKTERVKNLLEDINQSDELRLKRLKAFIDLKQKELTLTKHVNELSKTQAQLKQLSPNGGIGTEVDEGIEGAAVVGGAAAGAEAGPEGMITMAAVALIAAKIGKMLLSPFINQLKEGMEQRLGGQRTIARMARQGYGPEELMGKNPTLEAYGYKNEEIRQLTQNVGKSLGVGQAREGANLIGKAAIHLGMPTEELAGKLNPLAATRGTALGLKALGTVINNSMDDAIKDQAVPYLEETTDLLTSLNKQIPADDKGIANLLKDLIKNSEGGISAQQASRLITSISGTAEGAKGPQQSAWLQALTTYGGAKSLMQAELWRTNPEGLDFSKLGNLEKERPDLHRTAHLAKTDEFVIKKEGIAALKMFEKMYDQMGKGIKNPEEQAVLKMAAFQRIGQMFGLGNAQQTAEFLNAAAAMKQTGKLPAQTKENIAQTAEDTIKQQGQLAQQNEELGKSAEGLTEVFQGLHTEMSKFVTHVVDFGNYFVTHMPKSSRAQDSNVFKGGETRREIPTDRNH